MTRPRAKVLAIVLAGGEGKRLMPLTADRAKPAVPFAGIYRLIDFALSNVVNSGYLQIVVLTQYKSHSLDRHVTQTWRMSTMLGNYVTPVPAQQRVGKQWYLGSADAIYQSLNLINDEKPDIVVVVGADHVYRMDFRQMVDAARRVRRRLHGRGDPAADRAGRPVRRDRRRSPTTRSGSASSSRSRPTRSGLPDSPDEVLASMGNYVFDADALVEAVTARRRPTTAPSTTWAATSCRRSCDASRPAVYDFKDNDVPGATDRDRGYWRDVGTLASYYAAHMDVVSPLPIFNLYNFDWPIYTSYGPQPPVKIVQGADGSPAEPRRRVLSPGVVVSGGTVQRSVLSPAVAVDTGAEVTTPCCSTASGSATGAVVRNAILDKNVIVPPGATIGVDPEADRRAGSSSRTGSRCWARTSSSPRTRATPAAARAGAAYAAARESTVSWALRPLGFGTTHSSAPREVLGLPAGRRPRVAERGAVRRDPGDRDHARRRTPRPARRARRRLAELLGAQLVGAGRRAPYDVGDADAAGAQAVAVGVGHARRRVDRLAR